MKTPFAFKFIFLSFVFGIVPGAFAQTAPANFSKVSSSHVLDVASTPDADVHKQLIDAIDQAQKSVKIWMFSWSDQKIADALVSAHQRGVQTQVILDSANFNPKAAGKSGSSSSSASADPSRTVALVEILKQGGVEVYQASSAFNLMHAKTLLIDDRLSIIMTMNLTKIANKVRDTAVFLDDPAVATDLKSLFDMDLQNSKTGAKDTPTFQSAALVVSPTNSKDQMVQMIQSAQNEILMTTENFGSDEVIQAMFAALKRGVRISMISPLCDMSPNHFYNIPHLKSLSQAGAQVKVMPYPASFQTPYMHQKMAIVDGRVAFVGSENLSYNSLQRDREIGVNFEVPESRQDFVDRFQKDLQSSEDIPETLPTSCSPL